MNLHRVYYFAYGSNMSSVRLKNRVPSSIPIGKRLLTGYRLETNKKSKDGSSKCNLVIDEKSKVWGVLFSLLEIELPALHRAEGLGYGYEEKHIHMKHNDNTVHVFFYVAQESHICQNIMPYEWYMQYVQLGALEHLLPDKYTEKLMNWRTQKDQNSERRTINQNKLALIKK